MANGSFNDPVAQEWQEEGLFARDIEGQLVRFEAARNEDYYRPVHLWIDGEHIVVPAAVPCTDSQGNILNDADGKTTPRPTTIYDATVQWFAMGIRDYFGDRAEAGTTDATGSSRQDSERLGANRIPVLCHQSHMSPVGACRVCSVEISRPDSPGSSIVPACFHPVRPFMFVKTRQTSDRIKSYAALLAELLVGDHQRDLNRSDKTGTRTEKNELEKLSESLGVDVNRVRFAGRSARKPADDSSPVIAVDHSACILCERCMRGCDEIKKNSIIGRTGKGYTARISFDLDEPMGRSNCVECGECMVSCPTDALTFRTTIRSKWWEETVAKEKESGNPHPEVQASELRNEELFQNIPFKFLQWNESSIVRRKLRKGQLLCRAGDFGATAFILKSGKFGIWLPRSKDEVQKRSRPQQGSRGWFGNMVQGISEVLDYTKDHTP